jgi:hypothetical protein
VADLCDELEGIRGEDGPRLAEYLARLRRALEGYAGGLVTDEELIDQSPSASACCVRRG